MTVYEEPQPWIELDPFTGELNPTSYASQAMFALVGSSIKQVHAGGFEITSNAVLAYAQTLLSIINDVQRSMRQDESVALNQGSSSRARSAVFQAVYSFDPPPFGKTEGDWKTWVALVTRRAKGVAQLAFKLYAAEVPAEPWVGLCGDAMKALPRPEPEPEQPKAKRGGRKPKPADADAAVDGEPDAATA